MKHAAILHIIIQYLPNFLPTLPVLGDRKVGIESGHYGSTSIPWTLHTSEILETEVFYILEYSGQLPIDDSSKFKLSIVISQGRLKNKTKEENWHTEQ